MLIPGSCHCANIAYELEWTPEPAEIPARACTCTFCTRHGAVWTACPAGSLRVRLRHPANVALYAFETKTADFLVCSRCGIVPIATSRIDRRLFAVVNVNTFNEAARSLLRRAPSTLDAESEAVRLARRARNWIGDVQIADGQNGQTSAPSTMPDE